jgi:hypothetical protein
VDYGTWIFPANEKNTDCDTPAETGSSGQR